ncbi:hypothetical protein [Carboxylicivirga caseinilyticus]|uniref:hypothetical protein n=1 Tax=Carboxylicivirga caseinilyticus TaxID=3417572 RepID=UPI003D35548C|nr:hypothetical protein [Marinilabiliaceae bacterium A049]
MEKFKPYNKEKETVTQFIQRGKQYRKDLERTGAKFKEVDDFLFDYERQLTAIERELGVLIGKEHDQKFEELKAKNKAVLDEYTKETKGNFLGQFKTKEEFDKFQEERKELNTQRLTKHSTRTLATDEDIKRSTKIIHSQADLKED